MADKRQRYVDGHGRQERQGNVPHQHGGDTGGQQAGRYPVLRMNAWSRLDPRNAANYVLQDQGRGKDQATHKTTPGQGMTAQQEGNGKQHGNRQQQTAQYGWNPHDSAGDVRFGFGFGKTPLQTG